MLHQPRQSSYDVSDSVYGVHATASLRPRSSLTSEEAVAGECGCSLGRGGSLGDEVIAVGACGRDVGRTAAQAMRSMTRLRDSSDSKLGCRSMVAGSARRLW